MMNNYSSNNIFLLTYNHLNDLVDKCINEHKDHKYPEGIICDTRYISEITHKLHFNVLRDIDELMKNLNNQGRRTFREVANREASSKVVKNGLVVKNQGETGEVVKFDAVAENQSENTESAKLGWTSEVDKSEGSLISQGENGEVAKLEPPSEVAKNGLSTENQVKINMNHEFRIIEAVYKDEKGELRKVYQLSPVAFLVLMCRYNDTIVYCLANFFYRVMKEIELSLDKLLNTDLIAIDEASELAYQRDSNDPMMIELFRENLPKYLALFGDQKNVVELMTGVQDVNKNGFCYATTLDVWKITGKTEHNRITKDIKSMMTKLKQDGFDIDAHFVEAYRRLENGRTVKVFEMDEIGFLTIMGKYYSWVLYDLAKFYISMKDNIEISGEGLLHIKKEILVEAYEVLKDIAIIKNEEKERVERNMFTDIDYKGMSDEAIAEETARIYKENLKRIKELKENFKQKYENKNILN